MHKVKQFNEIILYQSVKYALRNRNASQPDDMKCLASEGDVAGIEFLLPGFRGIRVEYRHPAFVETKLVEIAEELPVGIFALEVLRRLDFHGIAFVSILHAQVETSGAERHLTVDASLPVGDALKKRHEHEVGRRLAVFVCASVGPAVLKYFSIPQIIP